MSQNFTVMGNLVMDFSSECASENRKFKDILGEIIERHNSQQTGEFIATICLIS